MLLLFKYGIVIAYLVMLTLTFNSRNSQLSELSIFRSVHQCLTYWAKGPDNIPLCLYDTKQQEVLVPTLFNNIEVISNWLIISDQNDRIIRSILTSDRSTVYVQVLSMAIHYRYMTRDCLPRGVSAWGVSA